MTKKTFEAAAKAISEIETASVRSHIAEKMGGCFAKQNSRFNWDKWNKACNVGENN